MSFSDRMGITKANEIIQIDNIDTPMSNMLWNIIKMTIIDTLSDNYIKYSQGEDFFINMWHYFFKKPLEDKPLSKDHMSIILKKYFFNLSWYEKYNFLEYIANNANFADRNSFIILCDDIFENELGGYRFLDGCITPITNKDELDSIDKAIGVGKDNGLVGVSNHLSSALKLLSDKTKPDYRNSIKESISAVESAAKSISGNDKDSLGGALDKIKGKIKIHPSLERGFKQIYGYTSDTDGIRHAMMEESTTDFEDAKFMLVSSSAFINYMIGKSIKYGIEFKK